MPHALEAQLSPKLSVAGPDPLRHAVPLVVQMHQEKTRTKVAPIWDGAQSSFSSSSGSMPSTQSRLKSGEPAVGFEPNACCLRMSCRLFGRVRGRPSVSEICDILTHSVQCRPDAFAQVGVAVGVVMSIRQRTQVGSLASAEFRKVRKRAEPIPQSWHPTIWQYAHVSYRDVLANLFATVAFAQPRIARNLLIPPHLTDVLRKHLGCTQRLL